MKRPNIKTMTLVVAFLFILLATIFVILAVNGVFDTDDNGIVYGTIEDFEDSVKIGMYYKDIVELFGDYGIQNGGGAYIRYEWSLTDGNVFHVYFHYDYKIADTTNLTDYYFVVSYCVGSEPESLRKDCIVYGGQHIFDSDNDRICNACGIGRKLPSEE